MSTNGNPENLDAIRYHKAKELNDRGYRKYRQVDFDEAIADYTRALNIYPNFAVAYYNRGTVLYRLGELPRAESDFRRSVHLNPANPEFRMALKECHRLRAHLN